MDKNYSVKYGAELKNVSLPQGASVRDVLYAVQSSLSLPNLSLLLIRGYATNEEYTLDSIAPDDEAMVVRSK